MTEATLEQRAKHRKVDVVVIDEKDAERVRRRQRRRGSCIDGSQRSVDVGDVGHEGHERRDRPKRLTLQMTDRRGTSGERGLARLADRAGFGTRQLVWRAGLGRGT